MKHLDEGTIHAWLDGALDAAQAHEVEAHVAECPSCSAAVAHARGLIAGASRILIALDDVPGGVLPQRAPTPRKHWGATRWVTGIAAALILAVGVTTWNRNGAKLMVGSNEAASPPRVMAPSTQPATVNAEPASPSAQSATGGPAVSPRRAPAAAPVAGLEKAHAANAPRAADATKDRDESTQKKEAATAPAEAPAAAAKSARAVSLRDLVVTSVASERARDSTPAGALNVTAPECYRVDAAATVAAVREPAPRAAPNAAAGAVASTQRRTAQPSAPAAAESRADYSAAQSPSIVRLDTTTSGSRLIARNAETNTFAGYWQDVGSDSVRVTLSNANVLTFARTKRTTCP